MQRIASNTGNLNERTPIEVLTGETPDIFEFIVYDFYDWIVFKQDTGFGKAKIYRFLEVATEVGLLRSNGILPESRILKVKSKVQRLSRLEKETDAMKQRMERLEVKIISLFDDEGLIADKDGLPDRDKISDIINDLDLVYEFYGTFSNKAITEEDSTSNSCDPDVNTKLALNRDTENNELGRVTKRLRANNGKPIGRVSSNPMLDSRSYEVEFLDGY